MLAPPQPARSTWREMTPPLRAYCASLLAMGHGRIARQAALVLSGAAVEGLGIVMLVPLLMLVFGEAAPTGRLGQWTQGLLHYAGRDVGLCMIVALFIVLVAVRGLILWRRDRGLMAFSGDLVDSWRTRLVGALAQASWTRLRALNRGTVEFALTSDVARLSQGSDRLLRGGMALVQFVVLAAFAIGLSPLLALGALVLIVPVLPMVSRFLRAAWDQGNMLTAQGGRRHNAFGEFMAGLKLAKAHEAQGRYADEFIAISDMMRRSGLAYADTQIRNTQFYQSVTAIAAALLLLAGIVWLHIAPAVLSALLVLFARLPGPAIALAQGTQSMTAMLPAVEHLIALEAQLADDEADTDAHVAVLHPSDKPAALTLTAVRYAHGPHGDEVLRGVDLRIDSGEFVALLGPSGSGKTTLGDMLIGLTTASSGTMTVDAVVLSGAAGRTAWRRQIGYVPQDPFLFDRSLRENLCWAAPEADDQALWHALELAEAAAFVRALPEGLDTRAGDRGSRLSGGERQRLCLARALLRRPRLLVLDEATNALDTAVEARLLETLARLRGSTTIVMITHRLPRALPIDRVYHLAGGVLTQDRP